MASNPTEKIQTATARCLNKKMDRSVLLHTCCAVCLPGTLRCLQEEGFRVKGYFYNPNIHPLLEFRKRLKAVKVMNERLKIPFHYSNKYGLHMFLALLEGRHGTGRCKICYEHRLAVTARFARLNGFDGFTSTLLVSHEQHHEMIRELGNSIAEREGMEFVYRDFRPFMEEGKETARRVNVYRQQYCGCIFSEEDRFKDSGTDLYKGQVES